MPKLIFLFLDGTGVGRQEPENPFFSGRADWLPFFDAGPGLPDGTPVKSIACDLGISGVPQSATGQTALFTGVSGAALAERHKNGFPDRQLRQIIVGHNIFRKLRSLGVRGKFINAYPLYADTFTNGHVRIEEDGRFRFAPDFPYPFRKMMSVTTCMLIAGDERPGGETDIMSGRALYQDYSNVSLISRGLRLPEYSPEKAAEIIYRISREFDFILYEYFQTDLYAHRRTVGECMELVSGLNRLVGTLTALLDRKRETLVITSDHGNLEDLSARHHTANPVPLIAWGKHGERLRKRIKGIEDLTPEIEGIFARS
jgi:2,3-bisphosphoglycerate-independent phosphoglycerate mutase